MPRFARDLLVPFAYAVGAAAAALATVAGNAATGSPVDWLPSMNQHPLRWLAASMVVAAGAGLFGWWAPRRYERTLHDQVPAPQLPDSWVVQRPAEVDRIVRTLCRRAATVGVTTAVRGAGGFGKSTVARMVRADRRVLRRFGGRIHWVTLGRDARRGALVDKVNDLVRQIAPDRAFPFTDVQLAADHLAAVIAAGPRRLVIVDDVWFDDQLAAFPVSGRSARLVTTRNPALIGRSDVAVVVDHMTGDQARAVLTADLPALPADLVDALMAETGRWPLLLRLINKILADQCRLRTDTTAVGRELLHRLRDGSALQVDVLTGAAGRPLDVGDPDQRRHGVTATIEASTGLLTADERRRFTELGIFAEDETIPVGLVVALWRATGAMDTVAARALCARLGDLALLTLFPADDGGTIGLHDVIRDYLREELGAAGLRTANDLFLTAVAGDPPLGWWLLPEPARYLRDHLIGHLTEAGRTDEAAATASDLRWIVARLEHSGPNGPHTDLIEAGCERLGRVFGQVAHLLDATVPAHSRADILYSRVAHEPFWRDQVEQLTVRRTSPALVSRWPLPDLPHPDVLRIITAYVSWAEALAVAPDGSWLATTTISGPARIWDTATGELRLELLDDNDGHLAVVAAPDGSWLATAGYRGRVRIWDAATGEVRLQGETGAALLRLLVVAPDGSWLATAGEHGTAFVWDVATGDLRFAPIHHPFGVSALAVAPDGSWLATTTTDGKVHLWDAATGQSRAEPAGHSGAPTVAVPAPDGSWLATADTGGTVRVWDSVTGELRADLAGHRHYVGAAAVSPDGSRLAVGDASGALWIWDPATATVHAELPGSDQHVSAVVVSADGSWLAAASGNAVRTWDTAAGELRAELLGHTGPVRALAIAPDGSWLASTGHDGSVRIWDATTGGRHAGTPRHGSTVCGMALGPDGSWLATGSADGLIRLRDVASGEQRAELGGHREHAALGMPAEGTPIDEIPSDLTLRYEPTERPTPVTAVVAAPDGSWLASAARDDVLVRIWDVADGRALRTLGDPEARATMLAVAPDGSWLAGRHYRSVSIWDVATGERSAHLTGNDHWVVAMAAGPDGSWLATGHEDGSVLIWDLATGRRRLAWSGHPAAVTAMAVASDGSWLVSGSFDGSLRIWDMVTGRRQAELSGRPGDTSAVAISPDDDHVASAGADGSVRIWDVRRREPVAMMRVNAALTDCAWTPDGRSVVVGGAAGLYRFGWEAAGSG